MAVDCGRHGPGAVWIEPPEVGGMVSRRDGRHAAPARRQRALPHLRAAGHQHRGNRGRHPPRAQRFGGHARRRKRHDQPADRRALPLLAEPREPAAVHAPPRIGRTRHRHPVALAGPRTRRQDRRVERGDHQRSAEQGDRLALDRRIGRRQRRLGELRRRRPGPRHAGAGAPAVQPAGRQGRRCRRQAARPRRRPRRSARTCGASSRSSRRARCPTTKGQPRG